MLSKWAQLKLLAWFGFRLPIAKGEATPATGSGQAAQPTSIDECSDLMPVYELMTEGSIESTASEV